jgi:DNA repair ATPase RecN
MIDYTVRLNILKSRRDEAAREIEVCKQELNELAREEELTEKVRRIFVQSSILGKETAKVTLENAVTEGLGAVHCHNLKFVVNDVTGHGKAGCSFKIKVGDRCSGLHCFGGGIRNIISVILRFIFAEFTYPKLKLPLILDEVGSNLSREYQEKFGELLAILSRKFNRQVILISHQPNVIRQADAVVSINSDGESSYIQ